MPTKKELLEQAEELNLDVTASNTKAEIQEAIDNYVEDWDAVDEHIKERDIVEEVSFSSDHAKIPLTFSQLRNMSHQAVKKYYEK